MKKLLSLLLVLSMLAVCFVSAVAEEPVAPPEPEKHTSGDYRYIILEDGTAEISSYRGKADELAIPNELDGIRVTGIGDEAFYGCRSLTSVTIPDSVTGIGKLAFGFCDSLTSVTIPEGVTVIGGLAFSFCDSLASVPIPDSVTGIGTNPFEGCSQLTDIIVSAGHPYLAAVGGVLFSKPDQRLVCYPCALAADSYAVPDGIRIIGDEAFYGCSSLSSVTIPDSVTAIGNWAFSYCDALTSVTIPDSVTRIGDYAFLGCVSLFSVTIPDSVTGIGYQVFSDCASLASVAIPDSVTVIGDRAFSGCRSLTSVTIPDNVTDVGDWAFYDCRSLTSVTIPGSVTRIGGYVFSIIHHDYEFIPNPDLTVTVPRDSYAKQYCEENGISYTYSDTGDGSGG